MILSRVFSALLALLLFLPAACCPKALAKTYIITDGRRSVTYSPSGPAPLIGEAAAIRRGLDVRLFYHGEAIRITSMGETVGSLLTRLGLEPGPEDVLTHSPETPLTDGMELRIDSVITRRETYTVAIPHGRNVCTDPSLPRGTEDILVEGRDGELLRTAQVTYVNGQETGREILQEKQTIAPVTEVIGQGTGVPETPEASEMPIIKDGYILMPTGELLTYYKTDNVTATGYTHTDAGCDLITSTGTTVRYGTAAVDPRFIPYGTRMLIVSHDGERYYGIATAEDCGGAIKRDRMDLYFPTYQECIEFGRRRCTIYFLG